MHDFVSFVSLMKDEQYHSKKTFLNFKDENLWNSHWCLII